MTHRPLALAAVLSAASICLAPAPVLAQSPCYGVEDGYEDNEFGWGAQYRCNTSFRPAIGFYGGIERPYPYGGNPSVTPVVRNGITYGYNPNYPGGIGPIGPVGPRVRPSAEPPVRVAQRAVRAGAVRIYRAPRVRPYRPAARRTVVRSRRVIVR